MLSGKCEEKTAVYVSMYYAGVVQCGSGQGRDCALSGRAGLERAHLGVSAWQQTLAFEGATSFSSMHKNSKRIFNVCEIIACVGVT